MANRSQFRFVLCAAIVFSSAGILNAQTAPAAPAQLLPSTPKITYINGQLTIRAVDVSLGDVLRAVSVKTGAVIEFPADRAGEHLFANAGPGPVREVLATLLNGSRFNYVMLGSPTNANILQRMILTSSDEPAQAAANQPLPAVVPPVVAATDPDAGKALTPNLVLESQQLDMEAPKEPLSPDAIEAMMKAHREARKLQHQQEAGSQ